jgi:hypothetical protein
MDSRARIPQQPDSLPLLEALAWQQGGVSHLTPEEQLSLYERNWRFCNVLATPSPAEIQYIRALAHYFRSDLCTVV